MSDMLDQLEPGRGDGIGGLGFAQLIGRADASQQRPEFVYERPPRQFVARRARCTSSAVS
jgi:hypothetical protein